MRTQRKLGQQNGFGQVHQKQKERKRFATKKYKKNNVWNKVKEQLLLRHLLKFTESSVKKVDHPGTEDEGRKHGEQSGNAG